MTSESRSLARTLDVLGGGYLGLFGAGHLGRTLAALLVEAGLPRSRLLACHGGSEPTRRELAKAGLPVVDSRELVRRSRIIFYLVRPQEAGAIAACPPAPGALVISFLAGVRLARLRELVPESPVLRVLPSSPENLLRGRGIAAVFPGGNPVTEEILAAIRVRPYVLDNEEGIHAFTALGLCLPVALTLWEAQGRAVEEGSLESLAERNGLPGYRDLLRWAREVQPEGLSPAGLEDFIASAATKGGVTEAIVEGIQAGRDLADSLEAGIRRSIELGRAADT